MTSFTLFYEMACQNFQKKQEEKQLEEEQAAKAQKWKLPVCYDDDDEEERSTSLSPCSPITPNEPVLSTEEPDNSLSMGDEHLDTISAMESDEVIKSSVENLISILSESEGIPDHMCDVPFHDNSPPLDSCSDEDFPEEIYSNPLFEEEIISIKIDQHHFNAESDLVESLLNHDSSITSSSSKIDSLLDEFTSELTLLKSIPPRGHIFGQVSGYDPVLDATTNLLKHLTTSSPPLFYSMGSVLQEGYLKNFLKSLTAMAYSSSSLSEVELSSSLDLVKGKQEKDKIGSKPDKNGKRGRAGKSKK
nr:hypothetical protein [Tanacetum cinerariifolium]